MSDRWHDMLRKQESASYTLQPRRDLVAESIERTKAKIAACFSRAIASQEGE